MPTDRSAVDPPPPIAFHHPHTCGCPQCEDDRRTTGKQRPCECGWCRSGGSGDWADSQAAREYEKRRRERDGEVADDAGIPGRILAGALILIIPAIIIIAAALSVNEGDGGVRDARVPGIRSSDSAIEVLFNCDSDRTRRRGGWSRALVCGGSGSD